MATERLRADLPLTMSDTFRVDLERLEGFRFRAGFDSEGIPPFVTDEPPPLGKGEGPNPARLLAAAVGNCLAASLLFCLSKRRVEVQGLRARVDGTYRRNERNRLRIGRLDVELVLDAPDAAPDALAACLESFEDFCVVTATVRAVLEVGVRITDPAGRALSAEPTAR